MKFDYYINDKQQSCFEAIIENEEEKRGFRGQAPYSPIELVNNILIVNYVSKKDLHPDIIASICITAFFPFIKNSVTVPLAVSRHFANSIHKYLLLKEMVQNEYISTNNILILNVDDSLEPYSNIGTETVISYSGGMDSTSVALLLPNAPLISTSSFKTPPPLRNVVKNYTKENLRNKHYFIEINCDELCFPGGFTTWTNIYIAPLILSSDLNIKNICSGTPMTARLITNKHTFYKGFRESSGWEFFYKKIGLHMFSPILGCSELVSAKIVYKNNLGNKVLYCEKKDGFPCFQCFKCFRKTLQLAYHGLPIQFDHYDEKSITYFLTTRPIDNRLPNKNPRKNTCTMPIVQGSAFLTNIDNILESLKKVKSVPSYMGKCVIDLLPLNTSLFNKIYKKSFDTFPEELKKSLEIELSKYGDFMNEEEEKYLENYDLKEYIFQNNMKLFF